MKFNQFFFTLANRQYRISVDKQESSQPLISLYGINPKLGGWDILETAPLKMVFTAENRFEALSHFAYALHADVEDFITTEKGQEDYMDLLNIAKPYLLSILKLIAATNLRVFSRTDESKQTTNPN